MNVAIITICLIILAIVILACLLGGRLPERYHNRRCQGKNWHLAFPSASKEEIRSFLSDFIESFAINDMDQLKLNPEDKILDIYNALNPHKWTGDALEIETLAVSIEQKTGLNFESIWNENLSLGELFSLTQKAH